MEAYATKVPEEALFFFPLIYYVEVRKFTLVSDPARPASTAGNAGLETGIHNRHMEGRGGFNLQMQPLRQERLVCLQQVHSRCRSITFNNRFELSFLLCQKVSHLKKVKLS